MEFTHPYSRYGLALVMVENNLTEIDEINSQHLKSELTSSLNHFRIKPAGSYEGIEKVKFSYMKRDFIQNNKAFQTGGKPSEGIFLCPNIVSTDKAAGKTWLGVSSLIEKLTGKIDSSENLTMSLSASSAKFNNGKKSQSTPKSSLKEVACAAITNTTKYKPCLAYRTFEKGTWKRENTTIIPDLPLPQMVKFIELFKSMLNSETSKELLIGNVSVETVGKGDNAKEVYKPYRPKIFNGNFPNPPQSSALGSLALLGAIGEWSKKAGKWSDGEAVLNSLEGAPIYMISYGKAKTFTYNHYVIELAKEDKLSTIVDSIHYTKLFNAENRSKNKNEYQVFDLFASRFLLLFNQPAFKDFLAFRAEYPYQLEILFTTYFTKMEKINKDIVQSAKEFGRWLNYVAFLAAKTEFSNTKSVDFKKAKAKVLVEIESSAFSAKTGAALMGQIMTRVGRLAQNAISSEKSAQIDAPSETALFVESVCSENPEVLSLEDAKNLVMAFSRLRNKFEKSVAEADETEEESDDSSEDSSEYNED